MMTVPIIYRISRPGQEPIGDVDSVEAVEGAIRVGGPDRYHVDEISSIHWPRDTRAGGGETRLIAPMGR
jgi:hypothetical protein